MSIDQERERLIQVATAVAGKQFLDTLEGLDLEPVDAIFVGVWITALMIASLGKDQDTDKLVEACAGSLSSLVASYLK